MEGEGKINDNTDGDERKYIGVKQLPRRKNGGRRKGVGAGEDEDSNI